jgi:hypothetical protein
VALRVTGSSTEAHSQFLEALRLQPNNPQFEVAAHPDAAVSAADSALGPKPEDGSVSENIYTNRFFGFTYQFPKGWAVLSSDAARAMGEIGGVLISTGDPTEEDLKKAAARQGHPLLYVMEGRVRNQPISMTTVMISAIDIRPVPGTSAESYIKGVAQRFSQLGTPLEPSGSPGERSIGGRIFWQQRFVVRAAKGIHYSSHFVTADKGYLLLFTLAGPDATSLGDAEKSLDSIRFLESSN